jgi:hypothetical protein
MKSMMFSPTRYPSTMSPAEQLPALSRSPPCVGAARPTAIASWA